MAISFIAHHDIELVRGPYGEKKSAKIPYTARCTANEQEPAVADAFVAHIPTTFDGMIVEGCTVTTLLAGHSYACEASYTPEYLQQNVGGGGSRETYRVPTGAWEYGFNFRAESPGIIKRSRERKAVYKTTGPFGFLPNDPGWGQEVGVEKQEDGNHKPMGIEIPIPPTKLTIEYSPALSVMTSTYIDKLDSLCGCINSTTFLGRAPQCVMLVGVSGRRRDQESWTLTLEFAHEATETNIFVPTTGVAGEGITVATKRGMDLLWYYTLPAVRNGFVVDMPIYGFVDRVYKLADLNQLDLP